MSDLVTGLINNLENKVPTMLKVLIAGTLFSVVALMGYLLAFDNITDVPSSTVMITNLAQNSGGSGVVIKTGPNYSEILTNKHVCGVVANGGVVKNTTGVTALVANYTPSNLYDLCVIKVNTQFPKKANIAKSSPAMYDEAMVSGHPALLPNVLTGGHFSGNKIIPVFEGTRKCTPEDMKDNQSAFLCAFFGGLPIIHVYDSILVTATIMPGSSGSAIYNKKKELSALVFAGSGGQGLSYAFAIPLENINFFLTREKNLNTLKPNYNVGREEKQDSDEKFKMVENCNKITNETPYKDVLIRVCTIAIRDLQWRNVNQ